MFLVYINGENNDRCEVIEQLLDEARDGAHEIVTSTVSEVEVAYAKAEQDGEPPDSAFLAKIEELWLPDSPVELIEFHRLIGTRARDLVRESRLEHDKRLTPLDAIHLASALQIHASELHTYDTGLLKRDGEFGLSIKEPWTASPRLPGVGVNQPSTGGNDG